MRRWMLAAVVPCLALAGPAKPKHPPAPRSPPPAAAAPTQPKPAPPAPPAPSALPPEPVVSPKAPPAPAAVRQVAAEPWLYAGARAGMIAPLELLRPGWEAGAQARMPLPLLDGRLFAGLYLGGLQATGGGAVLIPGRGYDPALIQNRLAGVAELSVEYALLELGPQVLSVSAGYGAYLVRDSVEALGAWRVRSEPGHAFFLALGYRMALGPGLLGISARAGLGAVAPGSQPAYGSQSLNGVSLALSYELSFLDQEKAR